MSHFRWKNLPPFRKDKYGYYLCRLCKHPCPPYERSWCSEACLKQYLTMSSGTTVRGQLFERDKGVCAQCGVDAGQMDRALAVFKDDLRHPLLMSIHPMIVATLRSEGWTNVKCRGGHYHPDAIAFSSCWEADHITAVSEGGGQCGLENYRTLCYVCHKKVSAEQAGVRADTRNPGRKVRKRRKRVM
jgi:5-methylcytosine-specific restriction endonuclease McrA